MIPLVAAILTALFFPGIILRVKSIVSGRKGPGILQPWKNILLLLRKKPVTSRVTGMIFRFAPLIYFSTTVVAVALIPFPGMAATMPLPGDFIFLAMILALGKFFLILGALDTGSSFEGMGANREALYSMLAEPAFFILFATLVLVTGNTSMQPMFNEFHFSGYNNLIIGIILVYLLVQIAMIENSRMPVDDPKTHLELTMIHEVMILDNSAGGLALIQLSTILKFALYGALIAALLVPAGIALPARIAMYFGIQAAFAATIGLLESFRARKKLSRNPQFIATLSSIAVVAFILALLITFKMIG
jgi:formate hydrogenlyase subunit 4